MLQRRFLSVFPEYHGTPVHIPMIFFVTGRSAAGVSDVATSLRAATDKRMRVVGTIRAQDQGTLFRS
jgi:hypothetical protein